MLKFRKGIPKLGWDEFVNCLNMDLGGSHDDQMIHPVRLSLPKSDLRGIRKYEFSAGISYLIVQKNCL